MSELSSTAKAKEIKSIVFSPIRRTASKHLGCDVALRELLGSSAHEIATHLLARPDTLLIADFDELNALSLSCRNLVDKFVGINSLDKFLGMGNFRLVMELKKDELVIIGPLGKNSIFSDAEAMAALHKPMAA